MVWLQCSIDRLGSEARSVACRSHGFAYHSDRTACSWRARSAGTAISCSDQASAAQLTNRGHASTDTCTDTWINRHPQKRWLRQRCGQSAPAPSQIPTPVTRQSARDASSAIRHRLECAGSLRGACSTTVSAGDSSINGAFACDEPRSGRDEFREPLTVRSAQPMATLSQAGGTPPEGAETT